MRAVSAVLCALAATCCALAGGVPIDRMTADDWREDLAFLARELPKRHANLYRAVSERQWKQAVDDLDARIPSLSGPEIEVGLTRLVAMAGDGHTELWLAWPQTGLHRYPIVLYFFGNDLRVSAAGPGNEPLIGGRIMSFDGMPAAEAFEKVKPLLAHDNEMEYLYAAPSYLVIPEILHALGIAKRPDAVTLALELDGEESAVTLHPVMSDAYRKTRWVSIRDRAGVPDPLYMQKLDRNYWYEWLPGSKTVFVKYNRCENQDGGPGIRRFAQELFAFVDAHPVERFVIDLRHNPGGNYELNPPIIDGIRNRPSINRKGHLFALIGRRTFSAATVAAIDLKYTTEAILVGENSRSRPNGTDNMETMHLPSSRLRVDYTDRFKDHAPQLGDAPYVPIDRPINLSFEECREGRDPVLEAVLNYAP